jgi:hypothetical protein
MKERPIIFSAPMVRAIVENKKTQTRRIVNPQSEHGVVWCRAQERWAEMDYEGYCSCCPVKCPYGEVGDQLWVRETVELVNSTTDYFHDVLYLADGARVPISSISTLDVDGFNKWLDGKPKRASIHMPRWASRLTLEITDIRVERVQDITEEDAWAEGCTHEMHDGEIINVDDVYRLLWDSINGKKQGCAWQDNPWIWAITFKLLIGKEASQ